MERRVVRSPASRAASKAALAGQAGRLGKGAAGGVIEGINIIAFLKLDTNLSSSSSSVPEPYPMTFAGFSNFLQAKMREAYPDASSMSEGLEALMMLTISGKLNNGLPVPYNLIIHHPEFLPLEVIATLYIEAHRILRRQLPANGQPALAYNVILDLHALLGGFYFNFCASDDMVKGWLGRKQKQPGLLGAFGIPAPPGNQASLKKNPMGWKDGVHLMLHRFPSCKTFCSGLHDVVPTRDLFYLFVNLVVVSRGYSEFPFFTNVKKVIFKRSGAIPDECRWRWLPQPAVPRPLWGRARRWHPRSLGNCTELQALLLSSNNLDDIIPPEIGRLKNLRAMDVVSRNSLSGPVPAELWWLRSAVGACVVQSKLRMLCGGQGPHWRESCRVIGVLARA
ncbi:unnamed protein product [Miscanthus lutarioriparius]|uniref:Uncharacterized protein n=1 Tax=Miscanthus lutarioriparius TaxID=422564 RepID=A0A811RSB0_9POAL|nr:unnamed protein product [Miscanthus lutarioriparius]